MSKSLLVASAFVVIGTGLAYSAGVMGLCWRSVWFVGAGVVVCLLGAAYEGMAAYEAGRQDREAEAVEEMYNE